jgi:hypothetical protein
MVEDFSPSSGPDHDNTLSFLEYSWGLAGLPHDQKAWERGEKLDDSVSYNLSLGLMDHPGDWRLGLLANELREIIIGIGTPKKSQLY